ncbi:MAG TPA: DUF6640 family protein [Opitutaceae bacterium]|nr:DUF6640 family protein [Opitutaceae bacterium]
MNPIRLGRIILTLVLLIGSLLSFALDWSGNHLLNPLWHPHARFHGALLLFTLAGVSATAIWLMWRKSKEPEIALTVATLIAASFWTPFFYITFLLPSSTLWAGDPNTVPHIGGHAYYPNLAVAAVFIILTLIGYTISKPHTST